jgi:hypothetical protein
LRRKLEWIAPVFLIALWVQFFAPVMAGFAMAASSDPLSGAPICTQETGGSHGPNHHATRGADCCVFCTQAHAKVVLADPPTAFAISRQVLVFRIRARAHSDLKVCHIFAAARARGPPGFS